MEQRFTSAEVIKLTGITPRQLQWWDERGIVVPQREGRRRLYSFDDVTEVAVALGTELRIPVRCKQEKTPVPGDIAQRLCMEVGRDVGSAIVAKAPDCGSKAIGFYAEYFPGEGLIDIRITVVAVR